MKRTKFLVFWRTEAASCARDFDTETEARAFAGQLLDDGGWAVEGVRLERHEPSPYHEHYDTTTLPLDAGAAEGRDAP